MLTQEQLIIKLFSEEHLNVEERKILEQNSLTISFITKVIEKYLAIARFIPNAAQENGILCPAFEGECVESSQKTYTIPWFGYKFIRKKYILHSQGYHGKTRKKIYKNLSRALQDYIKLSYNKCIDGIKIRC